MTQMNSITNLVIAQLLRLYGRTGLLLILLLEEFPIKVMPWHCLEQ